MSAPQTPLAEALRKTAARIESDTEFRWTHQGRCNCGQLMQTISSRTPEEIHAAALERAGDWAEHAREYCPTSGYEVDTMLTELMELGMSTSDIAHLERLSDPRIVRTLPLQKRHLDFRNRTDTAIYMRAWAELLDD